MRRAPAAALAFLALLAPSALAQAPPLLLAYEPVEPGPLAGRFEDRSGAGNAGLMAGFSGVGDGVLNETPGDVARLRLDGPADALRASLTQRATANVSVSVWFNATPPGGVLAAFRATDGTFDRQLYLGDDGVLRFGAAFPRSVLAASSGVPVADGRWHHAVGVARVTPNQTAALDLYVDGKLVANVGTPPSELRDGSWSFGEGNLSGWPGAPTRSAFVGDLGPMRVYRGALAAADVAALHAEGAPRVVARATVAPDLIPLGQPSLLVVTVRSPTGARLADVGVRFCGSPLGGDEANPNCTGTVRTDADGVASVSVQPLATGTLALFANDTRTRATVTVGAALALAFTPAEPQAGDDVTGIVTRAGAAAGEPGVNVRVTFNGSAVPGFPRVTGSDGAFRLPDVQPGVYAVTASKVGFPDAARTLVVPPSVIPPTPAFDLSNLVVAPTATAGRPLTIAADVRNVGEAPGNATAQLVVDGVVRDQLDVVLAPGAAETVAFDHTATQAGPLRVTVRVPGWAELPGTVVRVDPEAAPLVALFVDDRVEDGRAVLRIRAVGGPPGARVVVVDEAGNEADAGPTGADLTWLGGPSSGTYRVEVRGPGADGASTVLDHETVLVTIAPATAAQLVLSLATLGGIVLLRGLAGPAWSRLRAWLPEGLKAWLEAKWHEWTEGIAKLPLPTWVALLLAAAFMAGLVVLAENDPYLDALAALGLAAGVFALVTGLADLAVGAASRTKPVYRVWAVGTLTLAVCASVVRLPFGYTGYVEHRQENPSAATLGRAALASLGAMAALAVAFAMAAPLVGTRASEAGTMAAVGALAVSAIPLQGFPGKAILGWSVPLAVLAAALGVGTFLAFDLGVLPHGVLLGVGVVGVLAFGACLMAGALADPREPRQPRDPTAAPGPG